MSLFCGGNCDPYTYLFFGGGGGSGNPSGSSGGQAGGAILISANRIQRTSGTGSVYIRADGTNGINQSATDQDSGGGGGGGTLFINTKELNTTLNLSATEGQEEIQQLAPTLAVGVVGVVDLSTPRHARALEVFPPLMSPVEPQELALRAMEPKETQAFTRPI